MSADWADLRNELRKHSEMGLTLPLWWRDDDATAQTPALDQLAQLADRSGLPVHIAVIPKPADSTLAQAVAERPCLIPLVHGWQHVSHSPQGAKKAEFGHPRAGAETELHDGLSRLRALFGPRLRPVFVPPWNRFDPAFAPVLARAGYTCLSTFLQRDARDAAPGIRQVNTHIDPINWRGDRGLVLVETLIGQTLQVLRDRRDGKADATEPLGLLTHHLVHTPGVWHFSERWLREMLDGGAVPTPPDQQGDPDEPS
ncbi:polysaccharide deacetylase [uncultured Roseobacter sp.]|uniref:polysaccharide deacetylase n=1 Tax=uncultured Roseobacter sp. TaxID=114847 RepID=UPI002628DDF5|nr:polysaccharide deacetylase [uncultured Roseobacter sp.]